MLVLIVWILLGAVAGAIAHSKGHSFGLWWLLGFLLPIIGILMALMVTPKGAAKAAAELEQNGRACPYCAETIKAEAIVCRFCGKDLEPVRPLITDTGPLFKPGAPTAT